MEIDPATANITPILQELICPVCLGIIINPVQLQCGHPSCLHCMVEWLQHSHTCPCCTAAANGIPVPVPRSMRRILEQVTAPCENQHRGCTYVVNSSNVLAHRVVCIYQMINCTTCNVPQVMQRYRSHVLRCTNALQHYSHSQRICVDCHWLCEQGIRPVHCAYLLH